MKNSLIILILIFFYKGSTAQSVTGKITDREGNPIPYATVYISELKHGTSANIRGEYVLKIDPGRYTIYFQSLGYSPDVKTVTLSAKDITLNVALSFQYYEIPEVRVTSTGEDPAYAIMRKTIAFAPYHLNQVSHWEAEIYIKGSVVMRKIPKIMEKSLVINDSKIKEGDSFLIESLNHIEFNAPDKYIQTVVSQQSTFPETNNNDISPMDVVKASFYQPVLANIAISPLSPNAMAYYKFRYEGSTVQGFNIINKIAVIPRRKSQQVFEGTIYIVEDLWCLHSVDLVNENLAGSLEIKQIYTPVYDNIWMPVNHRFRASLSVMGVKADGEYGSAVTFSSVIPNPDLQKPEGYLVTNIPDTTLLPVIEPKSKDQEKIEQILEKKEISNRDMIKLSRLMEKEAKKADTTSKELEIKESTTFSVEKEASSRDTAWWNRARPIPLSEDELKSIRISDSIKMEKLSLARSTQSGDTTGNRGTSKRSGAGRAVMGLTFGKNFSDTASTYNLMWGGLFNPERINFNSVDGLRIGTDVGLTLYGDSGLRFTLSPVATWSFAREKLMWSVNTTLLYNRMHQSSIFLRAGSESLDFNNAGGINQRLNMFTSLFLKENYLKLYKGDYIVAGHRRELFNGFYYEFRYSFEKRELLVNNTDFSITRRNLGYNPNIPDNPLLPDTAAAGLRDNLTNHQHMAGRLTVSYTPFQRYRIKNGIKSPAGSDYPTMRMAYEHGVTRYLSGESKTYDLLRFEIYNSRNFGAFSEYSWRIRAGGFLNNDGVEFQDFFHFNSQPLPLMFNNYQDAFMLPSYYSLATPDYFLEAHARITLPYLFLKMLPVLSNTLMRENLSIAYLYTPSNHHYYEFGYALSEVLLLGKIGVYAGFNDLDFAGAGVRVALLFN